MSLVQGLFGVGSLLSGAIMLVSAITGFINSSIDSDFGYGLAFSGVLAMILGAIVLKTNG